MIRIESGWFFNENGRGYLQKKSEIQQSGRDSLRTIFSKVGTLKDAKLLKKWIEEKYGAHSIIKQKAFERGISCALICINFQL